MPHAEENGILVYCDECVVDTKEKLKQGEEFDIKEFRVEWDVPFEIAYWQIDEKIEHDLPGGERIVIMPKGKNDSKGHVYLTLLDNVVSPGKATQIAESIVNDILFENFLMVGGENLRSSGVTFFEPLEINKEEIKGMTREVSKSLSGTFSVCAHFNALDVEQAFDVHQKRQKHERRDEMDRSVKWLLKGNGLSDPVDQFLMYWISFNVLYGCFVDWEKQHDRKSINSLLNSHPREKETVAQLLGKHSETIDILAKANLMDWREQTSYSQKLQKSLRTEDYRGQVKKVALCLYVVRNQIFHGGAGLTREPEFYNKCSSLLFDLLRMTIVSYAGISSKLNED